MYEADIRKLKTEGEFLKLQQIALLVQPNDALVHLETPKEKPVPFNTPRKGFFELLRSATVVENLKACRKKQTEKKTVRAIHRQLVT